MPWAFMRDGSKVRSIIDIGGQDIKVCAIDTDSTVKNFAMNDKRSRNRALLGEDHGRRV